MYDSTVRSLSPGFSESIEKFVAMAETARDHEAFSGLYAFAKEHLVKGAAPEEISASVLQVAQSVLSYTFFRAGSAPARIPDTTEECIEQISACSPHVARRVKSIAVQNRAIKPQGWC